MQNNQDVSLEGLPWYRYPMVWMIILFGYCGGGFDLHHYYCSSKRTTNYLSLGIQDYRESTTGRRWLFSESD
jgi:hypothetical protein